MKKEAIDSELIPAEEVAVELGTTVVSVLMHIKRRLLEGEDRDGEWYVRRDSLIRFQKNSLGKKSRTICRPTCGEQGGCGPCGH